MKSAKVSLPREVSEFVSRLGSLPYVAEVTLYGSRARRDHRSGSDFDLFLVLHHAGRADQRHLKELEDEINAQRGGVVHLLGVEGSQVKRRLRSGEIVVFDALVEGTVVYPEGGAIPSHRDLAGEFSLKAAGAQWMAVSDDSIASSIVGHEILPASSPLSRYWTSYVPVRARSLAISATRAAMWAAFCLSECRPDRTAALDTMARQLGWSIAGLAELLEPLTNKDVKEAEHKTKIAMTYVDLARKLANEHDLRPTRLGHEAVEAYRQILEKHPSRLDGVLDARTTRILGRVRAIPVGFVRTYGDIDPKAPRLVGHILATTHERLPWHRVVRADGSLAQGNRQRDLLLREGVPMRGDRVDLRQARLPSGLKIP